MYISVYLQYSTGGKEFNPEFQDILTKDENGLKQRGQADILYPPHAHVVVLLALPTAYTSFLFLYVPPYCLGSYYLHSILLFSVPTTYLVPSYCLGAYCLQSIHLLPDKNSGHPPRALLCHQYLTILIILLSLGCFGSTIKCPNQRLAVCGT